MAVIAVFERMDSNRTWRAFLRRTLVPSLYFVAAGFAQGTQPALVASEIILRAGGSDIRAEVFEQSARQERPAILVLHGAGGTLLDGPEMRRLARHLAAEGNAVYLVHYFERTGTLFARDATMQKNFETWLTTVRDSISAVQVRRGDISPVGIYGYSLGGFLALAAASDNPRVGAVAEQAGGVWNERMERVRKMPAVLMIHGEGDARVPFEKYARPLVPVLRRRAAALETRFFAGEGHSFTPAAMGQVRAEAARFFRRHLVGERGAPPRALPMTIPQ